MKGQSMNALFRAPVALAVTLAVSVLLIVATPAKAMDIREVTSPGGVKAWLVEDYSVPIISIRVSFKGGSAQDPSGKEGLANLMTGLFDEGAGDLDSDAFQEKLDAVGAEMSFSASDDAILGSMRMLADTRDEAFGLLASAVNQPRFDPAPLDRIRAQIVTGIEADSRDPEKQAALAWNEAIYGDHPYARRSEGTADTLSTIRPDDLKSAHRDWFARNNLHVGVVGAISEDELKTVLDKVFGNLPAEARLTEVGPAEPKLDQTLNVGYDLPQTSLRIAYPGVERNSPEFYAAYLMNHILGGGTFSSRLYDEVREKRGLAYSIGSYLVSRDHSAQLLIATATRSDRVDETVQVIDDVIAKMVSDGPTEEELESAKRNIIGGYAISNLDNSSAIANTLVSIQDDDLGIDYIARREKLINDVSLADVKAEAARLLSVKPAVMRVGPEPAAPASASGG